MPKVGRIGHLARYHRGSGGRLVRDPGRYEVEEFDRRQAPEPTWDEALERLENYVLAQPEDRALPDLATIAERAAVPLDFLREDERAHKVLLEAVGARPLSSMERIKEIRTEVELLTLEVHVLRDRLREHEAGSLPYRRDAARLADVRLRLREIQSLL